MAALERTAAVSVQFRDHLPRPDDRTLRAYLLNAAETIHRKINAGLAGDSTARLRECATVIARVAQNLGPEAGVDPDFPKETRALQSGEFDFAAAELKRAAAGLEPAGALERSIDPRAIESYLRGHPLGAARLVLTDARLIPGGRCKVTALISQSGSQHLPVDFIFRQDWQGGATDTTVAGEYALLQRVSSSGIRAPRPLLLERAATAVGAPFILLERMPGEQTGSLFTPPRSAELGLQLAEQMGRLHSLPAELFRGDVIDGRLNPAGLSNQIDAFKKLQKNIGIRSSIVDTAIDWLFEHTDDAGADVCLIHNDLGFHNFLTDQDELSAILDWELASLGHPAADLGYVKPFVNLMVPWSEFVRRYQDAGGWTIDARALRFHTIWNAVRLYGLIMQARSALVAGLVNDIEITFACADNTMLLLRALAGELVDAGV